MSDSVTPKNLDDEQYAFLCEMLKQGLDHEQARNAWIEWDKSFRWPGLFVRMVHEGKLERTFDTGTNQFVFKPSTPTAANTYGGGLGLSGET